MDEVYAEYEKLLKIPENKEYYKANKEKFKNLVKAYMRDQYDKIDDYIRDNQASYRRDYIEFLETQPLDITKPKVRKIKYNYNIEVNGKLEPKGQSKKARNNAIIDTL